MKAAEVRSTFLDYFVEHGHERVASSSLVPANDPTLLFTNAGMVQFKDVFTGQETRAYKRATTAQKVVRAGGKHNDLDEVGKTARHHTFFEMLGNFSFGDYFKEDAIAWAWELLIDRFGIDPKRMVITVYGGDPALQGIGPDDEARAIWKRVTGFGDDRVIGLGLKENFWMMGETGPMGPCSEIHYAVDPARAESLPTSTSPAEVWDGWLEIWNLVLMQFERKVVGGPLDPLPAPSIDTGAGLERVTSVLQGVDSNYKTDLFLPLLHTAAELAGKKYGADDSDDTSMRIIADHARASSFLIADGVLPEKSTREYVLRRIFRRAVRHGKLLGIEEPFMFRVCERVIEEMGDVYPELRERAGVIREVALEEERAFRRTLERGMNLLEDELRELRAAGKKEVPGDKVFQLYDTYGFPEDLTQIIADEQGFGIDKAGFQKELEDARNRSRFDGSGGEAVDTLFKELANDIGSTEFLGYDGVSGQGVVVALIVGGARADRASAGDEVAVICDRSPFYAEAGGQVGDTGTIRAPGGVIDVTDCIKPAGGVHVHKGVVVDGAIAVGDTVDLEVDEARRNRIRANHSATHLLHLALKQVLGDHVAQKGSLVAPDRLRFDFTHFGPMTDEQKREVEDKVNREILRNVDSKTDVLPFDEAKKRGAVAMFGEKYGDVVRVVGIGGESLEFCGGTHVHRAGDVGLCKIIGESSVAQGVRRLEAVTGLGSMDYLRKVEDELGAASTRLKAAPFEVSARVDKLLTEQRGLEKQIAALKSKLASGGARDLMSDVVEVDGVKVLATSTEVADAKTLRETGDMLRDKLGSGVVVLAGVDGDKVALLAMVSKDLTGRFHAGQLLKSVAQVLGGRGGGRPDMAQGGGKDAQKVPEALQVALSEVRRMAGAA